MSSSPRLGVIRFDDDDQGFFDWLDQNPDGYFLNTARNPKTHLTLHLGSCRHIGRSPSHTYTKERVKLCSQNRAYLEQYAEDVGIEAMLCRTRFG